MEIKKTFGSRYEIQIKHLNGRYVFFSNIAESEDLKDKLDKTRKHYRKEKFRIVRIDIAFYQYPPIIVKII